MLFSRFVTSIFAISLTVLGIWIAALDHLRSQVVAHETTYPAQLNRAQWAAWLGLMRGDLWADYAFLAARQGSTRGNINEGESLTERTEIARAAGAKAVRFAPHQARVWLLLASLEQPINARGATLLKMSYYSDAYEISLLGPRLQVAAQFDLLADSELGNFVDQDIRLIIRRMPELKSAIIAAHRDGAPAARQAIEGAVGEYDRDLLKLLVPSGRNG
jgi:hypothetical protein